MGITNGHSILEFKSREINQSDGWHLASLLTGRRLLTDLTIVHFVIYSLQVLVSIFLPGMHLGMGLLLVFLNRQLLNSLNGCDDIKSTFLRCRICHICRLHRVTDLHCKLQVNKITCSEMLPKKGWEEFALMISHSGAKASTQFRITPCR